MANRILIQSIRELRKSFGVITTHYSNLKLLANEYFEITNKTNKNEYILGKNRDSLFLTQTPQAFNYKKIYNLSIIQKNKIQDEATLFIENNLKLNFIKGEILNNKITFKEDLGISSFSNNCFHIQ